MSKFKEGVIRAVSAIPFGKVASYGQVALYLGVPRAARQVGWTLNQMKEVETIPWWRVVNNQGRMSIKNFKYSAGDQRRLLRKEGVEINEDFTFDIEKYRFIPGLSLLKKMGLDPNYLEIISRKVPYNNYFPKIK
jgi:methylated-DNA-protein-cysteine methyltransferase related protein